MDNARFDLLPAVSSLQGSASRVSRLQDEILSFPHFLHCPFSPTSDLVSIVFLTYNTSPPFNYNFQKMSQRVIFSIYFERGPYPYSQLSESNCQLLSCRLSAFSPFREISQCLINEHFAGLIVRGFVKRQSTAPDLSHFTNLTAKFENVNPSMLLTKLSLLNFPSSIVLFLFQLTLQNTYMVAYPDPSFLLLMFTRPPKNFYSLLMKLFNFFSPADRWFQIIASISSPLDYAFLQSNFDTLVHWGSENKLTLDGTRCHSI